MNAEPTSAMPPSHCASFPTWSVCQTSCSASPSAAASAFGDSVTAVITFLTAVIHSALAWITSVLPVHSQSMWWLVSYPSPHNLHRAICSSQSCVRRVSTVSVARIPPMTFAASTAFVTLCTPVGGFIVRFATAISIESGSITSRPLPSLMYASKCHHCRCRFSVCLTFPTIGAPRTQRRQLPVVVNSPGSADGCFQPSLPNRQWASSAHLSDRWFSMSSPAQVTHDARSSGWDRIHFTSYERPPSCHHRFSVQISYHMSLSTIVSQRSGPHSATVTYKSVTALLSW